MCQILYKQIGQDHLSLQKERMVSKIHHPHSCCIRAKDFLVNIYTDSRGVASLFPSCPETPPAPERGEGLTH